MCDSAVKYAVYMWMQEWKYLHLVHICIYEHVFIFVYSLDFCIIYKGMHMCVCLCMVVHTAFE